MTQLGLILATEWYPDLNPLGAPSIVAAVLVACLAVATSNLVTLSPGAQRILTVAAPILFLGIGSLLYYLWHHYRTFPNLSDFIAAWTYVTVGFLCGARSLTFPVRIHRVLGALYTLGFGALIVANLVINMQGFAFKVLARRNSIWWDPDPRIPLFIALGIFGVAWAVFVWQRTTRRQIIDLSASQRK
jgi:hypothetical protein